EQIYNYAYTGEPIEPPKPEAANLYLPVDALLAESSSFVSSVVPADPADPADPGIPTDFVVTTKTTTTAAQPEADSDPNAMRQ
ncbi:hypothetical protein GGF43_004189, partial [Coemansia sp. RSA 2618]